MARKLGRVILTKDFVALIRIWGFTLMQEATDEFISGLEADPFAFCTINLEQRIENSGWGHWSG